jgi:hypothetical protein
VLSESQGASAMQATEILWGMKGWPGIFVKGSAAPFIGGRLERVLCERGAGGSHPL